MNQKFPCSIVLKVLLKITMLIAVTFVTYGFISNATTSQSIAICYRKLEKDPWCCKKCIKNIVPFSQLLNNQINNLMLGSLMTSPKQIIQENQEIFPNDKQSSVTANEIFTPNEFHNPLKTLLLSNLYLHMNISSLSYHIDGLKSLITNYQVKPKIIGISECRLKKKFDVPSKVDIEGYSFEYTTTESSKAGTLIYIDNNIKYKIRNDLKIYKSN